MEPRLLNDFLESAGKNLLLGLGQSMFIENFVNDGKAL